MSGISRTGEGGPPSGGAPRRLLTRALVVIVALFVVAGPVTAGTVGVAADEAISDTTVSATTTEKVDIVIVFDKSESMDEIRYELSSEMADLPERLGSDGADVKYGLVTYSNFTDPPIGLTDDYSKIDQELDFTTEGTKEVASDALLEAAGLFRDGSQRHVIIVTNEDDDSSNSTREQAIAALDGVNLITVSPSDAVDSSCQFHTPPCDDGEFNELENMSTVLGGSWIDVKDEPESIVEDIVDEIGPIGGPVTTTTSSTYSSDSPDIDPVNATFNRTTVEIGEAFNLTITVENDGSADGTIRSSVRTDEETIASPSIDVPEGENRTFHVVHSFDEPGEYSIFYDHKRMGTVTVTPLRDTVVSLSSPESMTLVANVTDARNNSTVRIPIAHESLDDSAFGPMMGVWITPSHDMDFTVTALADTPPENDSGELATHVDPMSYLDLTSSFTTDDVHSMTIVYEASDDTVQLYRFVNGSWMVHDGIHFEENDTVDAAPSTTTRYVMVSVNESAGENETATVTTTEMTSEIDAYWNETESQFGATVPSFSSFAFGEKVPAFAVTDVAVDADTVDVGDVVVASISVENGGLVDGVFEVSVTAAGETVASTDMFVPVDESRTVELPIVLSAAGEYTISVDGVTGPTVTVEQAESMTSDSTTTSTTEGTETPGFGVVLLLAALVALAAGVALRIRQ